MERFFKLKENGTNVRTEIIAGFTTFITMAYIIFVNPSILSSTGMDKGAVFVATILAAVLATFIMGLYANVPFAQAPGMGLNAFFAFTVCAGMGYSWQQALAIVFICGLINILITVTKVRKSIINSIPESLQYAISGGIGLFIAYIGVKQAGLLTFQMEKFTATPGGAVGNDIIPALTNFTNPTAIVALIGLITIIVLMLLKVKGSILWGILLSTLAGIPLGVTHIPDFSSVSFAIPSIAPTFLKLDVVSLFNDPAKIFQTLTVILAFSLSDTFDTIGTFLGTGRKSGIFDAKDEEALHNGKGISSKLDRALIADATATSIGALLGTSNTTTYVESAAGIGAGGRTGLTSVTTGVLFLLCLFISPIAAIVPPAATAAALIAVGILMVESIANVKWGDLEEAAAAFFTIVFMPFSYSIANGVAAGFIFYVITKLAKGKAKDVHPIMYTVCILFILNFIITAVS